MLCGVLLMFTCALFKDVYCDVHCTLLHVLCIAYIWYVLCSFSVHTIVLYMNCTVVLLLCLLQKDPRQFDHSTPRACYLEDVL